MVIEYSGLFRHRRRWRVSSTDQIGQATSELTPVWSSRPGPAGRPPIERKLAAADTYAAARELTCLQTPHCTALHCTSGGIGSELPRTAASRTSQPRRAEPELASSNSNNLLVGRPGWSIPSRIHTRAPWRARAVPPCRRRARARGREGRTRRSSGPGVQLAGCGDGRLASARGQLFDPRDPGRGRRPCASRDIILPRKGESDGCPGSTASRVGGASVCTDAGWEGAATATATRATLTPGPERSGGWCQPAAS